jgi:outer membrane protein TolC
VTGRRTRVKICGITERDHGLAAARESFTVIERDLLPQTQRSLEAAQAAYRGGQGDSLGLLDALRTSLEIRLDRERALASIAASLADVERARGGSLTDQAWSAR